MKKIQSVERAMSLLFLLARAPTHPWRLVDLSERAGIQPTTALRLLATLVDAGVVRQDPVTKRFSVGIRVLELSKVVLNDLTLARVAAPHMQRLGSRFQESVYIVVLEGIGS